MVSCPRVLLVAATVLVFTLTPSTRASEGTLVVEELYSPAVAVNTVGVDPTRRVFVYLPPGYADTTRSYPTLYWIPGWETPASQEYIPYLNAAITSGRIPPVMVVHLDVREGLLMLNSSVFGRWAEFLTEELVPYIDGKYRTVAHARGRALMGHSTGGYAALLLPLKYPGVWAAVGLNDASVWAGCSVTLPFDMPTDFSEYGDRRGYVQAWTQIAIVISPNPQSLRLFDTPRTEAGSSEIKTAWDDYCLWNVDAARSFYSPLASLSEIAIVIPTSVVSTNRIYNVLLTRTLDEVGIDYTALHMPGTHGGDRPNRFITLAEHILPSLRQGHPTPRGARIQTWAGIKQARSR